VGRHGRADRRLRARGRRGGGARLDGIADAVSLTNNRAPDPHQWASVVADLREQPEVRV